MLSFLKRNKKKVAVAGASVVGIAVSWYTIWQAERHVRERDSNRTDAKKASSMRNQGASAAESQAEDIRKAAYFCLASNIESIRQSITELINTEECVTELKSLNSQPQVAIVRKVTVWERLKARTLLRCVVSIYSLVFCNSLLAVYSAVAFACERSVGSDGSVDEEKRIRSLMRAFEKLVSWNETTFRRAFIDFLRRFADAGFERAASHVNAISLKDTLSFNELTLLIDTICAAALSKVPKKEAESNSLGENTSDCDAPAPQQIMGNDAVAMFLVSINQVNSVSTQVSTTDGAITNIESTLHVQSEVKNGTSLQSDGDIQSPSLNGSKAEAETGTITKELLDSKTREELNELLESHEFASLLKAAWQTASQRFSDLLTEPFLAIATQVQSADPEASTRETFKGAQRLPVAKLIPLIANATNDLLANELRCARDARVESRDACDSKSLLLELLNSPATVAFMRNIYDAFHADLSA